MYIACDEFNDFIGNNNTEFISLLGSFWDYSGMYKNRIKNGKSVNINDPTVSILGGNTPTNFVRAFPPEILGQGFFSRLLLIEGVATGKRITFPEIPSVDATATIVASLQQIKIQVHGHAILGLKAKMLLDKIYRTYGGIDDVRFESYSQRRLSHLIKICLIVSATHLSKEVTEAHIVEANTILTHAEYFMPSALGEFGRSKNSDVTHKIMQVLGNAMMPMGITDLWQHIHKDMEKIHDLGDIMRNLVAAKRVMTTPTGFLVVRKSVEEINSDLLDWSYLTNEEREMRK